MSYPPFSEDWIKQFSDPYAALGVSIAADDRRVLKRFRSITKLLHPDTLRDSPEAERKFATQLLAKVVNVNYQKLKQEKGRSEAVALLRLRVRQMSRSEPLAPLSDRTKRLCKLAVAEVDTYYEQAIADLAGYQYSPLSNFEAITQEIAELNVVYLRLKLGEPLILEKRTGLVVAPTTPTKPVPDAPSYEDTRAGVNYAERHYQRAQEYIRKGNCQLAIQELKDAIRIDCNQSRYHALMAQAYLIQNLPGAAKAYCRKALQLDKGDRLAQACARRLKINLDAPDQGKSVQSSSSNGVSAKAKGGGLFGLFARKR